MQSICKTLAATAALIAFGAPALAQSTTAGSDAVSGSFSSVTVEGSTIPDGTPGIVAPGMSSGHPCAYTPASLGVSFVGGGAVGGGQRIDDACMLGQLGYTQASMVMVASRSPAACKALKAAGRVVSCGDEQAATTTSTKSVRVNDNVLAYSSCERRADGKLGVKVKRGADRATAIAQCRSAFR